MSIFSDEMVATTLNMIDGMFYNQENINISSVAKKCGVSRQFVYNHQELIDRISFYNDFNSLSVKERVDSLKSQNAKLFERLNKYDELIVNRLVKSTS